MGCTDGPHEIEFGALRGERNRFGSGGVGARFEEGRLGRTRFAQLENYFDLDMTTILDR